MRAALMLLVATMPVYAQPDETVPRCSDIARGDWDGQNCRLPGRDEATLFFDYRAVVEGHRLYFYEFAITGDAVFKAGPIHVEGVVTAPELRDVTGDGVAELFVPYSAGMVNIYNQVWRAKADGWHYAGDIGGGGAATLEVRDGMIVATERGSATVYYETAKRVTAEGIVTVYEMEVDFADRACRLTDDSGLAAAGLRAETVLARCSEWE